MSEFFFVVLGIIALYETEELIRLLKEQKEKNK
jgi:hypothetical protein